MIIAKPPLSAEKIKLVANAGKLLAEEQLPNKLKLIDQFKTKASMADDRARQMFKMLRTSAAEKAVLARQFFANIEQRIGAVLIEMRLSPKHFGFETQEELSRYLRERVANINVNGKSLGRFLRGMEGRKWWFIGALLFERYIKYGPVSKYLYDTAISALSVINKSIESEGGFRMRDIYNKQILVKSKFGRLTTGMEFVLETEKGEKQFLDFGHVAFNDEGHWTIPTPVEIKQPGAAQSVASQFSRFVSRIKNAKKLIIIFEKEDMNTLENYKGKGVIDIQEVDGKLHVEVDSSKLVFDPDSHNQIVVTPDPKFWASAGPAKRNPNVDIDVEATSKAGGFNYWRFNVEVSLNPFQKMYEAVFLGL